MWITGRVCDAVLRDEMTRCHGCVEREEVLSVVEIFSLDGVEKGLTQLLFRESEHKKKRYKGVQIGMIKWGRERVIEGWQSYQKIIDYEFAIFSLNCCIYTYKAVSSFTTANLNIFEHFLHRLSYRTSRESVLRRRSRADCVRMLD
jgi:hypothetical protein